ncbi:MAG: glycosyltransferase [Phycisphaerales bacterium]|nr:MAG: glycosyltransferase [Phycisphaerales bacterium]
MKTLLIHEHGKPYGSGGVIAVWRLHQILRELGVQSTIACRRRDTDDPSVVELPRADRIEKLLGKISWRIGLNDIHCLSTFKIPSFAPFREADVVNIHGWHTNYFNYLALPRLCRHKPVVATLHDMWNLTGHCAVSLDCDRWETGCGKCPDLETFPPVGRDATAWEWKLKNWVYKRSEMVVVAPSQYLAELARRSMLGRFDVRQIPNCVDTSVYRPLEARAARASLGLPPDGHMVMFGALSLDRPVKGGDLLVGALRKLDEKLRAETTLLLLGGGGQAVAKACGLPAVSLGYVTDDERKAQAYSAADVFLLPSRWENQGIVLLEATACGTPCVGFDVGGVPEVINGGPSGLIAPPEDTAAFADAVSTLLSDDDLRLKMGRQAREAAVREYDIAVHGRRYVALYEELVDRHKSAP